MKQSLQFAFLPFQSALHILASRILELSQSVPPKLIDILLRFNLYQPYSIAFLRLQQHLPLALLPDQMFVRLPLPLDLSEESIVALSELSALRAQVACPLHSHCLEHSAIRARLFVQRLIMLLYLHRG
jgi:hypothetical protein